jgi:hypothetical protein
MPYLGYLGSQATPPIWDATDADRYDLFKQFGRGLETWKEIATTPGRPLSAAWEFAQLATPSNLPAAVADADTAIFRAAVIAGAAGAIAPLIAAFLLYRKFA